MYVWLLFLWMRYTVQYSLAQSQQWRHHRQILFKVNNKDTRTLIPLLDSTYSLVDFGQVNAGWVGSMLNSAKSAEVL